MTVDEQNKGYRDLQIKLLRRYKRSNKETDDLYFSFHISVKIVFLARVVSSMEDFGNQQQISNSIFSIMECIDFF